MKRLTPTQFTAYLVVLTIGIALLPPNIDWLNFLACAILFLATDFTRVGRFIRSGWGSLIPTSLLAYFTISAFARWDGRLGAPLTMADQIALVMMWLIALGTEHRAWRNTLALRRAA